LGGFLHRNLHLEQMKVGIQNKKGWLILVWNDGKRRTMATDIRPDIAGAKSLAQKTTPVKVSICTV
jgi:hypothetical protein